MVAPAEDSAGATPLLSTPVSQVDRASTPPPAISVRGLTKSFERNQVLKGVDLDVAPGQLVSLLGPSGCGKTTLLQIVAGILPPDGGEVWIDGRLATSLPP